MGKPTGFMEYQRKLPTERSPDERVEDWGRGAARAVDLHLMGRTELP